MPAKAGIQALLPGVIEQLLKSVSDLFAVSAAWRNRASWRGVARSPSLAVRMGLSVCADAMATSIGLWNEVHFSPRWYK